MLDETGRPAPDRSCWTFVEVSVGGVSHRTQAVFLRAGDSALWHQELEFELPDRPAGGLHAPLCAHIRVYDQVVQQHVDPVQPALAQEEGTQTRSVMRRLLASTAVTLPAIALAAPLQGRIPLYSPPATLGYAAAGQQEPGVALHARLSAAAVSKHSGTVALEGERFMATSETVQARALEEQWRLQFRRAQPTATRHVYALVCGLDGMGVPITRFVQALDLPPTVSAQISRLETRTGQKVRSEELRLQPSRMKLLAFLCFGVLQYGCKPLHTVMRRTCT